jgi:hypothetical protein
MPNCRAIRDGVMPALEAARTALICPRVSETVAKSACRLFLDDERFNTGSSGVFAWTLGGDLPRRFASSSDAVISRSSSRSVRYLTALGRCLVGRGAAFVRTSPALHLMRFSLRAMPSRTDWVSLAECGHTPCRDHNGGRSAQAGADR